MVGTDLFFFSESLLSFPSLCIYRQIIIPGEYYSLELHKAVHSRIEIYTTVHNTDSGCCSQTLALCGQFWSLLIFYNSNRNDSKEASCGSQVSLLTSVLKRGTQARDVFPHITPFWTPLPELLKTTILRTVRETLREALKFGVTSQLSQYVGTDKDLLRSY